MHTAFITANSIGCDNEFPHYVKDGWVEKNGRKAYVLQKAALHAGPAGEAWRQYNPDKSSPTEVKWQVFEWNSSQFNHLVVFPGEPNRWTWPNHDAREIESILQNLSRILSRGDINLTIIGWEAELRAQRPYLDKHGIREFKTIEIREDADKMQGLLELYLDGGDVHNRPPTETCGEGPMLGI